MAECSKELAQQQLLYPPGRRDSIILQPGCLSALNEATDEASDEYLIKMIEKSATKNHHAIKKNNGEADMLMVGEGEHDRFA